MPSNAYLGWSSSRAAVLDEIESVHANVGGTGRGRRYAAQQINRAYAVLLSSEFQGFCRDLHTECADKIIEMAPMRIHPVVRTQFQWGRVLDRGNPQAAGIGSDFNRFGVSFWVDVYTSHLNNKRRRESLDELILWRNAIAHNDFDSSVFGSDPVLQLVQVRAWRSALNGLCQAFDTVMYNCLVKMLGSNPWIP
jgi:hypothetical protein